MNKFFKWGDRDRKQQEFDRKKITITKAGQTYNVYDAIQEANVDTDIVEVMKKYHCASDEAMQFMEKKGGMKGIYGEFAELQTKAQTIPQLFQLKEHAEQTFNSLPSEIKQKYGNDLNTFFDDLIKKSKEMKQETATNTETKTKQEEKK